jgi:hypothetical protein
MNLHEKIYLQLSKKYNLDISIIERICRSQWDFIMKTMEKGEKESIRLKYFGIFGVKARRMEYYKERNGNKKKEESGESNKSEEI